MGEQCPIVVNVEQGVEQARVAEVDPGRLHLAFRHVLEPRLQLANHVRAGQQVQVAPPLCSLHFSLPCQVRQVVRAIEELEDMTRESEARGSEDGLPRPAHAIAFSSSATNARVSAK